MTATIGLDIGGTKVLGVVLDADGSVQREVRHASPHTGVDCAGRHERRRSSTSWPTPEVPVGVGVAGLVDRDGCVALLAEPAAPA